MLNRWPQLGILAWVVLGTMTLNVLHADPPKSDPNPFGEANPKPGEVKPAQATKPDQNRKLSEIKLSESKAPSEADIRKALQTVVEVNFNEQALNAVIKRLALDTKTNIWIDEQALSDEGIGIREPLTLQGKPIAAARVLDRILEPFGLTWIIQDHVVQITTNIAAEDKLITVTYPVGDLIEYATKDIPQEMASTQLETAQFGDNGGSGCGCMENGESGAYWLIEVLEGMMTRAKWEAIDGTGGSISSLKNNLVIQQTHHGHEEVDKIIRTIREFTQGQLTPRPVSIRPTHYAIEEDPVVKKALTKVMNVKCRDVPLSDFLKTIGETLGIPVAFRPAGSH